MGSLHSPPAESSPIPIVDFSPWLSPSSDSVSRHQTAQSILHAFQTVGFVYLTNHSLSPTLLSEAFSTSKALFDLPLDIKNLAPHPPTPHHHRGYSSPGLEKVSQYMSGDASVGESLRDVVDCKESYEIGSETNSSQPNIWLPEDVLPGFRDFTTTFYWECNKLAREILKCIGLGLGLEDPEYLWQFHSGESNQLRLLHYPPVEAGDIEEGRKARMPAHSDWGTITMLFQDDCGGLEVEDPMEEGRFVRATPIEGACVVNVGDLLMRWSNDVLKSTLHRVTLPPLSDRFQGSKRLTRARYSIPYFVSADPEALVQCLPVCTDASRPIKYPPVSQQEYSYMRAKVQYRSTEPEESAEFVTAD